MQPIAMARPIPISTAIPTATATPDDACVDLWLGNVSSSAELAQHSGQAIQLSLAHDVFSFGQQANNLHDILNCRAFQN